MNRVFDKNEGSASEPVPPQAARGSHEREPGTDGDTLVVQRKANERVPGAELHHPYEPRAEAKRVTGEGVTHNNRVDVSNPGLRAYPLRTTLEGSVKSIGGVVSQKDSGNIIGKHSPGTIPGGE